MAYFTGDLSRDIYGMANVVGEIHMYVDNDSWVAHYHGSMDLRGWTPAAVDGDTTLRLSCPPDFTMDIRLTAMTWHGPNEPVTVDFISVGVPLVMPRRRSLIPPSPPTP